MYQRQYVAPKGAVPVKRLQHFLLFSSVAFSPILYIYIFRNNKGPWQDENRCCLIIPAI